MTRHLIVAGIDFGTSFTKVVVRDNNTPGSKALVVEFPGYLDGLLPSVLALQSGKLSLVSTGPLGEIIPYLKMIASEVAGGAPLRKSKFKLPAALAELTSNNESRVCVRALLAYFMAHVIASTETFLRTRSPWKNLDHASANPRDHLVFQLAVPSGLLSDDGRTEQLFREGLLAGYELRHRISGPLTQSDDFLAWSGHVADICADSAALVARHPWQCLIYPEVAGAVQAIFRAPNAGTGLHITMDIGAGTVDLNAFRRINRAAPATPKGQSGRRALDYYSALVAPLGVQHLKDPHGSILPKLESDLMRQLSEQIKLLYSRAEQYQPSQLDGDPTYNPWNHTTLFLFGGGARHTAYGQCLVRTLRERCHLRSIKPNLLPAAPDLMKPKMVEFGRFAVAYGLSFFRPNLDRVNLPHELKKFSELYPNKKQSLLADYNLDD